MLNRTSEQRVSRCCRKCESPQDPQSHWSGRGGEKNLNIAMCGSDPMQISRTEEVAVNCALQRQREKSYLMSSLNNKHLLSICEHTRSCNPCSKIEAHLLVRAQLCRQINKIQWRKADLTPIIVWGFVRTGPDTDSSGAPGMKSVLGVGVKASLDGRPQAGCWKGRV